MLLVWSVPLVVLLLCLDTDVQLLNQWESPGSPPASKEDIDNLPLVTITQEHIGMYAVQSLYMSTSTMFEGCKLNAYKHVKELMTILKN